jgi:hypothetical protein
MGFTSRDGAIVATGEPGELVVCDALRDRRQVLRGGGKVPTRLIGSAASWILTEAAGSDGTEVVRWDRSNNRGIVVALGAGWRAHGVLDDGRVVATSTAAVEVVDPVSTETELRCPAIERVAEMSSPLVFGVRGKALVVCDVSDSSVTELAADGGTVELVTRASDGKLVVIGREEHPGEVLLWKAGRAVRTAKILEEIEAVAVSADGTRVALVGARAVRIFDDAGTEVASIPFAATGERVIALSPRGDRLLVYERRSDAATLYDVATRDAQSVPMQVRQTRDMRFVDDTTMLFLGADGGYRASDRVPRDPGQLERWLQTVTNAVLDDHGSLAPK